MTTTKTPREIAEELLAIANQYGCYSGEHTVTCDRFYAAIVAARRDGGVAGIRFSATYVRQRQYATHADGENVFDTAADCLLARAEERSAARRALEGNEPVAQPKNPTGHDGDDYGAK